MSKSDDIVSNKPEPEREIQSPKDLRAAINCCETLAWEKLTGQSATSEAARNDYLKYYAIVDELRQKNPALPELPKPTGDFRCDLNSLLNWCDETAKHSQLILATGGETEPKTTLVKELTGAKKKTKSPKNLEVKIPAERRSTPLSLTLMAEYWGGDMTPKKLKNMIKSGSMKAFELNRQTYVFDTKYLPAEVITKVKS